MPTEEIPERLPIKLKYGEFDPLISEPVLPADLRLGENPGEENYYIVQFDGPVLEEWQKALDATGAERLAYVPEYAYVTRMRPAEKEAAAALAHIRWIGLFQPGYKIAPALENVTAGRGKLTIATFPNVDMEAIKSKITESGGVVEESSQNELSGNILVEIDLSQVAALARLPGVMWIEPHTVPSLH